MDQVANWFINARVRLWKPMVEDMYKEEFGAESKAECKSSPKNAIHGDDDNIYYRMMNLHGNKGPNTDDQKVCVEDSITLNQSGAESLKAADVAYNISALGNFAVENKVSLALGLQRSKKDPLHVPDGTEIKGDDEEEASSLGADHVDRHHVDLANQYRFCNPHLLPDFVA